MRHLPKLIEKVYCRPLLVTKEHFYTIHTLMQRILSQPKINVEDLITGMPDEDEEDEMYVDRGTAVIPIHGTIGNHLSAFEKSCFEVTDVRDIKKMLDFALNDPSVDSILLDINSPGGSVDYIDETAKYIVEAKKKKPVIAYCNDVMASAAMYLAAGASEIWAHPAASAIGSVGVYSAFVDESLAAANAGIKLELFSAGKYKTEGFPGTSLSADFKKLIQDDVNSIYDRFTKHMMETRGVSMDDMQGLTYDAKTAYEKKFIDGMIDDPMELFIENINFD